MLKVAVCDDDALFGKQFLCLIGKCASVPVQTVYYSDGAAFLAGGDDTDILFLDIDMPGRNGMELALDLRDKEKRPLLIFLTGLAEYVYDAFEAEAFDYLLKPVEENKLRKVLQRAIQKAEAAKAAQHLSIKSGGTVYRLPVDALLYVENQGRKLLFHTKKGDYSCYGRMEEYESLLPEWFFRCHRGYLISLKEVVSYERDLVRLSDGQEVLMAKKRYEAFLQACIAWLK